MTDYLINDPITQELSTANTSLDTQQTSDQSPPAHTYRTFLGSGIKSDLEFGRQIYDRWDLETGKKRRTTYEACRTDAWFVVHRETREVRVQSSSCGLRWCPFCIRTRRRAITDNVMQWLNERPRCRFITLTLRHRSAPLAEQIQDLYYFFKQLRKTKLWKGHVKGGIWFFQVKRSKDDRYWHPHLHILTTGKYFPQAELRELWRKITKGSYVVDIRDVKDKRKSALYVARYAAAPCRLLDYQPDHALECVKALHSRRICGSFGEAKGVKLRPEPKGDYKDWVIVESYFLVQVHLANSAEPHPLWQAYVHHTKYDGPLPEPPPDITPAFENMINAPKTFDQHFFDFSGPVL